MKTPDGLVHCLNPETPTYRESLCYDATVDGEGLPKDLIVWMARLTKEPLTCIACVAQGGV